MAAKLLLKNTNYHDPASFGRRMRARRMHLFLGLAEIVFQQYGHVHILDVGGTPEYWEIVDEAIIKRMKINITILNTYEQITGLKPYMHYVQGDACNMHQFANASFHLAHSNSVIEHVGSDEKKALFAKEIARVAERYYVQTPNFFFPVEPHFLLPFFHWLPQSLQIALCLSFRMGHYPRCKTRAEAVTLLAHNSMLSKKEFAQLFPAAEIHEEKFLGITKSVIAIQQ